ncbi:MAG TPA: GIY-YIG nuclease family protein [Chthoniobacterales bacterium]|nr:GIY-YIG nuclease family protein [Chthoniobacterales bacterium]
MLLIESARRMAPSLSRDTPVVYILQLGTGALYVGCTTDLKVRLREHAVGTACRTSSLDPPDALVFVEIQPDFRTARKRELHIKRWSHAKKLALIDHQDANLRRLSSHETDAVE